VALKKERPRPLLEDTDRAFWVSLEPRGPGERAAYSSSTPTRSRGGIGTIPKILGEDLAATPSGAASRRRRDSPARPDDGARGLGCAAYPRGVTKLGFLVSEMTVTRYMPRRPAEPDQVKRWVAFFCGTTRTTSPRGTRLQCQRLPLP